MFFLKQVIIVEGRYDKIKLSNFLGSLILCVGGFNIFKNKNMQDLIKMLAKKCGIVVLTDSDIAGIRIGVFIKELVLDEDVIFVKLPKIFGKEKRKRKKTKQSILGVEGIDEDVILKMLNKYNVTFLDKEYKNIEPIDLYNSGLVGSVDSAKKREEFLNYINISVKELSTRQLLQILNIFYSKDEFLNIVNGLRKR